MKNRLLHFMYHFTARPALCLLCLLMATGFDAGRAPRSLNINHESSLRGFLAEKNGTLSKGLFPPEAIACRRFEHNRQLAEIGAADKGRLLLLDLFDDAQYSAVIDNVTVSFDGVRGITAKIVDDETAYCFISLSDAGLSMSIDIPRRDEQYLVSTKDGVSYLAKIRLSDMRKYDLSCTDADEHHHDDHADSGHYDAPPGALEADADDCTFPPDTLTDAVTINLLFVYTEAAEQYAAAHYTSIDNVIDQAMLRSNTVMANSLTNVTFTLAYKHKTDYTEVDSDADLERITDPGDGYMDEVHALRKEYRADLVVFMPLVDFTGGVAWLLNAYIPGNGRPTYGFALSRVQQSSWTYTVVHEIGHNMGCGHHWRQQIAPGPGLFDYSSGYRGQNAAAAWYSTVMTYEAGSNFPDGNTAPRIAFFSDPDIVHDGVVIGRADSANNALTIRQSKHAVARYSEYYSAGLKCLAVSPGTLIPAFHIDTTTYSVTVPATVSSITVYAAKSHPSSVILSGAGTHSLACGLNPITVTVRSPTHDTISYIINVLRTCEAIVTPSDTTLCASGTVTLRAAGAAGAEFRWYDSAAGGTLLHTGDDYTVSVTATVDYYVSQVISGVESSRTQARIVIAQLPTPPTDRLIVLCYDGNPHMAYVPPGINQTIIYYTSATGDTTAPIPSRSAVGTTLVFAAARDNSTGCESAGRATVSITIHALPALPTAMNAAACYDGAVHTAGAGVGAGEIVRWYSSSLGANTTTAPSRIEPGSGTAYAAARDNVTGCESAGRTAVTVIVHALPPLPAAMNENVCYDGAVHTASATAGAGETIVWYTAAVGGAATVAPGRTAVGTTTAYAAAKNTTSNCESAVRTAVSVVVNNVPDAPVANNVRVCYDGAVHTASATAGAGETIVWYTAAAGGAATVAPGRSAAGTTTAYAAAKNTTSDCESTGRTAVSVVIDNVPNAPAANNVAVCYDGAVHTAGATAGAGETIVWYTAAAGGAATVAPSRSAAGTTTAYAAARNSVTGCESAGRTAVSVRVYSLPNVPAANNVAVCYDGAVHTAGATAGAGETTVWYTAAVGGAATVAPSRSAAGTTTTYAAARNTSTGCESAGRATVSITINALPALPVANNENTCYDGAVHTAGAGVGAGETIVWYTAAVGGAVTAAPSRIEPGSGTAYAAARDNVTGCESAGRTAVSVIVHALPPLPAAMNENVCYDGAVHTASATAGAGETIVWYTTAVGGAATVAPGRAAVGTATAYAAAKNTVTSCESAVRTAVSVVVNNVPDAPVANNVRVCYDGAVHTAGATAGAGETVVWYTAAAGGAATVAPGRSAAGTTTAYAAAKNTTSDCESTGRTAVSVVIDNVPNAPAANSVAVCYDGAVHTAGASAGAGEMTVWYTAAAGGAATVAPSRSAAGTTTAYAAARNSVSNCESAGRTAVSVRVYNLPNVPVANNVAVCYDGAVHTAGATAGAGETTVWYTAAVGGAATVAPSRSAAGTTTAYAAARNTATGCESAGRATVSITINALPALPAAMNADACYDGAVHTAGAGVAAGETIVWYTAAVGGAVTAAPSRIEPGTTTAYAAARNTVTGCESAGRTAVSVNVYSLPNAPVLSLSGDNYLCPDESVILTAETTGDTPFYAWFRNGAPASEVHALTWEVYQPGTYTIVAISDMGCPSEASVPQIITSVPLPERPIIAGDSLLRRHPGTSVEFTLLYVANDQHFQWYKDNEMIAGAAGATFTVSSVRLSDAGMYFVRAHTLYGDCVNDSRPVILEILHDDITVSTIVTPNNDNTNEFLHIDGLDGVVYEIKIVNRYGNEVFHTAQYSNDSQDGWKGDNLPDGVYFYRIDWIDQDGIKRHKVGYITLKR